MLCIVPSIEKRSYSNLLRTYLFNHTHTPHTHTTLILRRSPQRELEPDPFPRQLPIHLGVRIEPVIHPAALLLVQHDLQHLTAVLARAGALADDLDGVDDVAEDGVVHGRQGAAVGPLLGLRGAGAGGAFGAGQDAAGGEEEDVAVGELLFEFAG